MLMVNKPVCDADAIVFQAIFCTNEIVHTCFRVHSNLQPQGLRISEIKLGELYCSNQEFP